MKILKHNFELVLENLNVAVEPMEIIAIGFRIYSDMHKRKKCTLNDLVVIFSDNISY